MRSLLRLARRDVRRSPWRTVLTVALVAVPVATLVFAQGLVHAGDGTAAQRRAQSRGAATYRFQVPSFDENSPAVLPAGLQGVVYGEQSTYLRLPHRVEVTLTNLPAANPITHGMIELRAGRLPTGAKEVAVSPAVFRAAGGRLGARIRVATPTLDAFVVGVVVRTQATRDKLVLTTARVSAFGMTTTALVDAPHISRSAVTNLMGEHAAFVPDPSGGAPASARLGIFVLGGLGLAAFAIVIAAAFAVGTRRQLQLVGMLAANGGSPGQVRALLVVEGIVVGVLGAALGLAVGEAVLTPFRSRAEVIAGHVTSGLHQSPVDIVMILAMAVVAAIVAADGPGRMAAGIPVRAALAGRRPVSDSRPRQGLRGVGAVIVGSTILGLTAASTHFDRYMIVAVLAAAGIVAGFTLYVPTLLTIIDGRAHRFRGAGRLAVRSALRSRGRTSPVIAAVVAAGALTVGISSSLLAIDTNYSGQPAGIQPDNRLVTITAHPTLADGSVDGRTVSVDPSVIRRVRDILGGATVAEEREVHPTTSDGAAFAHGSGQVAQIVVADSASLRLRRAPSSADAALHRGHLVTLDAGNRQTTTMTVETVAGIGGELVVENFVTATPRRGGHAGAQSIGSSVAFVAQDVVGRLGLTAAPARVLVRANHDVTMGQRRAIDRLGRGLADAFDDSIVAGAPATSVVLDLAGRRHYTPWRLVVLAGGAVLAFLVVAIGLALTRSDEYHESAVLVALGAAPSLRRRMAAWQAWGVTFAGFVLAVPAGFLPVAIILLARHDRVAMPWVTVGGLVFVVPVLAAAGAALTTRNARRIVAWD